MRVFEFYQVLEQFSDNLLFQTTFYNEKFDINFWNTINNKWYEYSQLYNENQTIFFRLTSLLPTTLFIYFDLIDIKMLSPLEVIYSEFKYDLKNDWIIDSNIDFRAKYQNANPMILKLSESLSDYILTFANYVPFAFFYCAFTTDFITVALVYKITKITIYLLLFIFLFLLMWFFSPNKLFGTENVLFQLLTQVVIFIYKLIKDQSGVESIQHLPLIFSIFTFIFLNNILGLLPFGYTLTSHLVVTLFLSLALFLGITILILIKRKTKMINLFLPKGVPSILVPFLFIIEVISYFFRTISLAVRLFANMMAGHALLHILSNFGVVIFSMKSLNRFFFLFPLLIVFIITFLEFGIAILQAYVFAVLLTIYLNDVYSLEEH